MELINNVIRYGNMKQVKIYTLSGPKGVRYVGKTIGYLSSRLASHISEKRNSRKCNWVKSLKAKGIRPTIQLLDIVDEDIWKDMEIYWIQQFKDWGFDLVNTEAGGEDGNPRSVIKLDRDTGISIDRYGSVTEAADSMGVDSANISAVCSGRQKSLRGYCFKYEDDKEYVFKSWVNISLKSIQQLDKYTNEVLNTFETGASAAKYVGITRSMISDVCRGRRKTTGGYKWRYTPTK